MYSREAISNVIRIAKAAATEHQKGNDSYLATHEDGGGVSQRMNLAEGGMCNRFVRQCYEVGLGIAQQTWPYRAGRAIWTIDSLEAAGLGIGPGLESDLLPGDIVGIHTGKSGHIAIYVGDGTVAENTISATRGKPRKAGTKLTPYADLADRVTDIFRLADTAIRVVWKSSVPGVGDRLVTSDAKLIGGRAWAPVREMGVGLGFSVDASQLNREGSIVLSER